MRWLSTGSGNLTYSYSDAGFGGLKLQPTATTNSTLTIYSPAGSGSARASAFLPWTIEARLKLGSTTDTKFFFGWSDRVPIWSSGAWSALGIGGIRYDSAVSGNWTLYCDNNSTPATADLGAAANTSFVTLKLRGSGGSIYGSVNGGAEQSIAQSASNSLLFLLGVMTSSNSTTSVTVDYFGIKGTRQ